MNLETLGNEDTKKSSISRASRDRIKRAKVQQFSDFIQGFDSDEFNDAEILTTKEDFQNSKIRIQK